MKLTDQETFERFARRFAAADAVVARRRPAHVRGQHGRPVWHALLLAFGVVAVAIFALAVGSLVGGRPMANSVGGVSPLTSPSTAVPRTISIGQWTAECLGVANDICASVASLAINNLGRNTPSAPLAIKSRRTCPAAPDWADASRCWQADVRIGSSSVCLVVARRESDGSYAQIAGDVPGRAVLPSAPVGCPPDPSP